MFAVLAGVSFRHRERAGAANTPVAVAGRLNVFSHFVFLFFPSLLPAAADCSASNLCSRFGMFSFLSPWYFFPVSIFFFLSVVVVLCFCGAVPGGVPEQAAQPRPLQSMPLRVFRLVPLGFPPLLLTVLSVMVLTFS